MYKNVTHNIRNGDSRRTPVAVDTIIMAYINTQHSASKYTIMACQTKVKCKVSVWT